MTILVTVATWYGPIRGQKVSKCEKLFPPRTVTLMAWLWAKRIYILSILAKVMGVQIQLFQKIGIFGFRFGGMLTFWPTLHAKKDKIQNIFSPQNLELACIKKLFIERPSPLIIWHACPMCHARIRSGPG